MISRKRLFQSDHLKQGYTIDKTKHELDWVVKQGDCVIYMGSIDRCKSYIERMNKPVY